ncbi:PREDICTED: uncharacterized protein LOC105364005 [Ceratosolen solmsi marchali]|uniref:Inositol-pentakisphosphate 2-kinase n=1 Tax=Ceratosolen solmsi marchali TaxID=326594 RepID=A0AAJ7DXL1_9HYME|nr:PREDICTED: uncharacterized protein LOC105364005 [Ceratosolen solmsi marchali]
MIFEHEKSALSKQNMTVASISTTADASQYLVHSLPIEGCVYRGEGNANLVVALPSSLHGKTRRPSGYCPFDLFSGEESRMERALEALLCSPQNNLKIFKEGTLIYDEELADKGILERILADWFSNDDPLKSFLELTRRALMQPFDVDRDLPTMTMYELADGVRLPSRLKPALVRRVRTLLTGMQRLIINYRLPTSNGSFSKSVVFSKRSNIRSGHKESDLY